MYDGLLAANCLDISLVFKADSAHTLFAHELCTYAIDLFWFTIEVNTTFYLTCPGTPFMKLRSICSPLFSPDTLGGTF